MRLLRVARRLSKLAYSESGTTFIETIVALALLAIIAVAFLSGLTTTSRATIIIDKQTTAESLALSQMEWVKKSDFIYETTTYYPAPIPSGKDYTYYSAIISAEPLHNPDEGIQKITVTIKHSGKEVLSLENYKVDR